MKIISHVIIGPCKMKNLDESYLEDLRKFLQAEKLRGVDREFE
jgi:hypothetical protein